MYKDKITNLTYNHMVPTIGLDFLRENLFKPNDGAKRKSRRRWIFCPTYSARLIDGSYIQQFQVIDEYGNNIFDCHKLYDEYNKLMNYTKKYIRHIKVDLREDSVRRKCACDFGGFEEYSSRAAIAVLLHNIKVCKFI